MPHLQFDINKSLKDDQRIKFVKAIKKKFSQIMKTSDGHIAISLRELPKYSMSLGRARESDSVCFMNLDIRNGRTSAQKRELIRNYMNIVEKILNVKKENQYATFTSHYGNDFNLYEKPLGDWFKNDSPLDK